MVDAQTEASKLKVSLLPQITQAEEFTEDKRYHRRYPTIAYCKLSQASCAVAGCRVINPPFFLSAAASLPMNTRPIKQTILISLSLSARAFTSSSFCRPCRSFAISKPALHKSKGAGRHLSRAIATRGGSLQDLNMAVTTAAAAEKLGKMRDGMKTCGVDGAFGFLVLCVLLLRIASR